MQPSDEELKQAFRDLIAASQGARSLPEYIDDLDAEIADQTNWDE